MEVACGNGTLEIIEGDITELDVDIIVNAAGSDLMMGGGVAGAIRRKGGESIQNECIKMGGCPVGEAVITGAGMLRAKYVIHAVGPRLGEGGEEEKLRSAIGNALKLADTYRVESIAFPAISAGIFGFPIERGAPIMLTAAVHYLSSCNSHLRRVLFCLYGRKNYEAFRSAFEALEHA